MAEVININIGGRSLPIADTAYTKIQNYVAQVRAHFINDALLEDIVTEVESRFSELMAAKISEGAPHITEAEVDAIIAAMGSPENVKNNSQSFTGQPGSGFYNNSRKLYRNENNKVLGGVCSGIANWLNLDPMLIRVLFAVITLGGFGTGILIYIVLWIFLPSKNLFGHSGKRLFRNTDNKVFGGVCSGIATYFGKDVNTVRLLFSIPFIIGLLKSMSHTNWFNFNGFPGFMFGSWSVTFIIVYIILWILLPEPKSMYEKMEMYGKPIDLNAIKNNMQGPVNDIKERVQNWGQEVKDSAQRLGTQAGNFNPNFNKSFGKQFGPAVGKGAATVGSVIATIIKVIFYIIFAVFIASLLTAYFAVAFSGIESSHFMNFAFTSENQRLLALSTFILFIGAPLVGAAIWLGRRIMNVKTPGNYLRWLFGGLWTIGWICLTFFLASFSKDFTRDEKSSTPVNITQPANDKMIITVSQPALEYDNEYIWLNGGQKISGFNINKDTLKISDVSLDFAKSKDSLYHVTIEKLAFGNSYDDAKRRLNKINYTVTSKDSILDLASGFVIDKESKYRIQTVSIHIDVPVGKKIELDPSVNEKLRTYDLEINNTGKSRKITFRRSHVAYLPNTVYTMSAGGKLTNGSEAYNNNIINENYNSTRSADSSYRFDTAPLPPAAPAAPVPPAAPVAPELKINTTDSSYRFEAPAVAPAKSPTVNEAEILKALEQKEKEIQELKKKLRQ